MRNVGIDNEAERVVGNAFYMHHPYRRGGAGLTEFCNLLLIKKEISKPFLLNTLVPELDKLIEALKKCHSCRMKLYCLAALLCRDKLPDHEQRYLESYQTGLEMSISRSPRDYCAEVDEAFRKARDARATPTGKLK
jgi:hypothetical protein